jgi:DNA repair exonuclease SbcCD nuclease subunit
MDAFAGLVDMALQEDMDAMVLAGDIFDHRRPGPEAVDFLFGELRRFGRPVLLLPGNHDAYEEGSVWKTRDVRDAGEHVYLITDTKGQEVPHDDLGVVFWGRAYTDADLWFRPLDGLPPASRAHLWHVAVGHGHFIEDHEESHRAQLIRAGEIERSGWDYVALGHWDHTHEVSRGRTVAHYSGAPVPLVDGERRQRITGLAAFVTFDPEAGVSVEMRPVVPRERP